MNMISRRDVFRFSGLALAAPVAGAVLPTLAASQQPNISTPRAQLPLSIDLVQYVNNQHASIAVNQLNHAPGPNDFRALSAHWRLVSKHFRKVNFDAQFQAAMPAIVSSGAFKNIDQSAYYPAVDSAVKALQQQGAKLTRNDLLASMGTLPQGDITEYATTYVAKGLAYHCDHIANIFASYASGYGLAAQVSHAAKLSSNKPHFQQAGWDWCGNTKQEQYQNCYDAMTYLAFAIGCVGVGTCLVIPACAAALAAAGSIGGGLAVFGTVAALAAWLIGRNCAPILSANPTDLLHVSA